MMTKRIGMSTTYRRVAGPLVAVLLAAGAVTGTGAVSYTHLTLPTILLV